MKQNQAVQSTEKMTFKIVEIFSSLSGEGSTSGIPATFVRVSGCNLRCEYCDTKYSYNEEFESMKGEDVLQKVKSYKNKIVVCTGGEPLLEKDNARLLPLMLSKEGFDVYIETNGSVCLYEEEELEFGNREKLHYVVDVKCPASCMSKFDKLEENCEKLCDGDEIKCVIATREDFEFCKWKIEKNLEKFKNKKINIILSPVFGKIELDVLANYVHEMKELFQETQVTVKLGIQLHKLIWPNIEKGV